MVELLVNYGLVSVSLWLGVAAFVAVLFSWLASKGNPPAARLTPFLGSLVFLAFLLAGTGANLAYALLRAYYTPRDIMQDIISADEFNHGRSMYPDQMNQLMRQMLDAEDDPLEGLPGFPAIRGRLQLAREETLKQHWVQAHPPLLTLALAPFVDWQGRLGAQAAMLFATLVALLAAVWMVEHGLDLRLNFRHGFIFLLAVLGADPFLTTIRSGQASILLSMLGIFGWHSLKQGKPLWAGVAVGVAVSVKVFPGLLLVYFLMRQRRALASALVTIALLGALVVAVAGTGWIAEYRATTSGVLADYLRHPGNLSVLGLFARSPFDDILTMRLAIAAGGMLLAGAVLLAWRSSQPSEGRRLDAEYSLCLVLMLLLSPIAWDHYLAILLLPMSVLGSRALSAEATWSATCAFLLLAAIFYLPSTTCEVVSERLKERGWPEIGDYLLLPLRTYALLGSAWWLVAMARSEP